MPAAWPPEREVSFLLIQADAASRRGLIQALGRKEISVKISIAAWGTALLLSLTIRAALASEWIPLPSNSAGDAIFVDRSSIRDVGGALQIWTMTNLAKPKSDGTRSQKVAFLLNCETWEWAIRSGATYSEKNGEGQLLSSVTAAPNEIRYAPSVPDTVMDLLLKVSCDAPS